MSYLLSGGSRGLNPWIEATACQVVTAPPCSISESSGGATATTSSSTIDNNDDAKRTAKRRGPRIVQVLGRGGGWVDPSAVPAAHPQRAGGRCLSCPPVLVLSDGTNAVTAFVTSPPTGGGAGATATATAGSAGFGGGATSGRQLRLPPEEVSKICRRGTLIRIRDWRYTTMMLGAGRHARHLTGTPAPPAAAAATAATRPAMLCAVLPQNVPLTAPLALSVPWSSIEFIAGENGTVPIHHSHRLVDVNDSVELRRILMDNGQDGTGGTGRTDSGGIGPKNHLELSKRIQGWEEHFGNAKMAASGVASLPPVRISAARTAAILAGRVPPPTRSVSSGGGGRGDNNNSDEVDGIGGSANPRATVRLGDPTKLLGTRNLSALLQKGMGKSDDNQGGQRQREAEGSRQHQRTDQRGVRVGDASRLLSSSAGRAALRESARVGSAGTAVAAAAKNTSQGADASGERRLDAVSTDIPAPTKAATSKSAANTHQDDAPKDARGSSTAAAADDDDDAGPAPDINDAAIEQSSAVPLAKTFAGTSGAVKEAIATEKVPVVPLGDVRRLMTSKQGRTALRSAISKMSIDAEKSSTAPAPDAAAIAPAVAAAAVPVQGQPQAPPSSHKRRRGGVPRRSSQQEGNGAGIKDGATSINVAKPKPTTPQETLAALQSLDTASLHSLFNQILASGVEPEDDTESDSGTVPTPRKLSAMREGAAQEGEGSKGKDDEPLDLQFLLSDSEDVETSPEDRRDGEKKKATADEDDDSDDEEEVEEAVVGIGDMLVPPTQEQLQEDTDLPQAKKVQRGGDKKPGGMAAEGFPTGDNMELKSDEEDMSQETTQGSGENTAEDSPKKCPSARRAKEPEVIDSDATVDEQVVAVEKSMEGGIQSDSDTTAGEPEVRLPITSSRKAIKAAPTKTAPKVSSNQAAHPRALPPHPKSRRLYTAYDSSSSSDSEDWDISTPIVASKKTEGNKKNARKRLRHLTIAPPSAKKPRPAPKKATTAPSFSIQAMLARKKR